MKNRKCYGCGNETLKHKDGDLWECEDCGVTVKIKDRDQQEFRGNVFERFEARLKAIEDIIVERERKNEDEKSKKGRIDEDRDEE